jgi:hydrogenase maturation protease
VSGAASGGRRLVVALGEPTRRDDGCGPRVLEALRARRLPGVELPEPVADPTALLDLWEGAELAVVVDAMRSGAAPGSVARLEGRALARAPRATTTSSHGLSLRDAAELGEALGRMPRRLVAYLIEARDVGPGESLTAEVAAAVQRTAQWVEEELAGQAPRAGEG